MTDLDLQLEDGPHARTVDAGDPIDILAAGLERRRNKQLALDSIASVPLEAWSTSDLLAERDRVRSVLDQAPPDRSADLAALDESRRDVETKVQETKRSVAKLESRKRPRKERRLPDVDLLTQRHNLAHFEQQADDSTGRSPASTPASTAGPATWPPTAPTRSSWTPSATSSTSASASTPTAPSPTHPSYITRTLGPRPTSGARGSSLGARRRRHREVPSRARHHRPSNRDRPRPAEYGHALDWYRVNETVLDALDVISPPAQDDPAHRADN